MFTAVPFVIVDYLVIAMVESLMSNSASQIQYKKWIKYIIQQPVDIG